MRSYAITTFGCQMNVHDSERMREVLRGAGLDEAADVEGADVVLLNTCSVREKAEQKLLSEVGRLAKLRARRPDLVVVVAGCVAQQEGERLLKEGRGIDLVVGPDNIPELPRLLEEIALGAPPLARTVFDTEAPRFLSAGPGLSGSTRGPASAYVTVMKGCNERCSFCIVPYTRGPERYRPSAEILKEISHLVDSGVREVTLLGQTVNSYADPSGALPAAPGARADDPDESEFAALLRRIAAEVPGLSRLRYTSPHPRHLVPSLVLAHEELSVLARHVHLPVQSGSDRVLKRMIRRYNRAEYVARARELRARVPGLTLSTDVIVGFPGETDEDFEATLSLVREVPFFGLFGFKYSVRPYAPSRKLADDVPEEKKAERLARLFEESESLLAGHLASLVGSRPAVLFETASEAGKKGRPRSQSGRTERNEIVHVPDAPGEAPLDLLGEIAEVEIVRANKHSLEGRLTEASRRKARLATPSPAPARRALPLVQG